jgi:hypothetical protein
MRSKMQINKEQLGSILKQIKQDHPNSFIIMSPNSIGELLYTCGFAKSFINQYKSSIVLCVRPEHKPLVEAMYPNRFRAIVTMHMDLMSSYLSTGFVPYGYFGKDYPIVLCPVKYENGRILELKNLLITRAGQSGLSSTDAWRYMLRLNWDAQLEEPNMEWVGEYKDKFYSIGIELDNFALIQLGNNTNKPLPSHFYNYLEKQLSNRGHQVLANAHGSMLLPKDLVLTYSKMVKADAMAALALMKYSTITITGNNGLALFDWCSHSLTNKKKETHVITSNMYCTRYDLLISDWENAFEYRDNNISLWHCIPELILELQNFYEWFGDCNLTNDGYEKLVDNMLNKDLDSQYFTPPNNHHTFPVVQSFDNDFQTIDN